MALVVFFAALLALLVCTIVLAVSLRAKVTSSVVLAGLLAILCAGVTVMQPLGLKVLTLPKAADLPYRPLQSRVVKTYDESLWFEGIAAADDGTLYLTGNRGLDFSARKYYQHARGELIERKSDGTERTLFETPVGSTAGVVAVATNRTLYMTSHGDEPGIWRIAPTGESRKIAVLPHGACPHALPATEGRQLARAGAPS